MRRQQVARVLRHTSLAVAIGAHDVAQCRDNSEHHREKEAAVVLLLLALPWIKREAILCLHLFYFSCCNLEEYPIRAAFGLECFSRGAYLSSILTEAVFARAESCMGQGHVTCLSQWHVCQEGEGESTWCTSFCNKVFEEYRMTTETWKKRTTHERAGTCMMRNTLVWNAGGSPKAPKAFNIWDGKLPGLQRGASHLHL
eukprot:1161755-Pelagomonas_calceolata.AAC.5